MARKPFDSSQMTGGVELDASTNALAKSVIGAAIEVHRVLGPGFDESVYENALRLELTHCRIPFISQHVVRVEYRGKMVGEGKADMIVGDKIVVELKAVDALAPVHTAQVLAYLKATGHRLGLLMNFNVAVLKDGIKRVILSQ